MEVNYPDKTIKEEPQEIAKSRTAVLMPDENDRIFYFFGEKSEDVQETNYSKDGLRAMLLKRHKEVKARLGKDPIFIVKATDKAKYKNLVDIIDEFYITQNTTFAIVKITPEDQALVNKVKGMASAAPVAQ
jgi:hypothetical protein